MNRTLSIAAGVGYATIFGFSFLVTKDALDILDPMELIFARFLLAAVVMSLLAATRLVKLDYRGKKPVILLLTCLFQPVLYFIFETYGVRESATSTAGIILGALPAVVAILGVFMLKEKTTPLQSLGLGLSIAGVAIVVLVGSRAQGGGEGTLRGALFLIGSMFSAAFFNILSRKASRQFSDFERTFVMMWTGALVFGCIVFVKSFWPGADTLSSGSLWARTSSVWPSIAYLGILSSVLAFFFINYTLTRLKASQSAVFTNLVTVITVAAGVVIRKEGFDLLQGLGAIIIIAGVWTANLPGSDARSSSP
ncbi:MAG: EamA family transporter [Spirochaetae bacterium HGW-Spirochaetae-9]|nr:MAG: EamA family transporter [Spirochaetae bacterium HGW-Spirochaetae-9]